MECLSKFPWHVIYIGFTIFLQVKLLCDGACQRIACLNCDLSFSCIWHKLVALWRWDCWSIYPQFYLEESSKLLIQQQSTLSYIFCEVPNCTMFISATCKSSLKAYMCILYTHIQNKENSLSLCGKLSSHWKQQWPVKKRGNNILIPHILMRDMRVHCIHVCAYACVFCFAYIWASLYVE